MFATNAIHRRMITKDDVVAARDRIRGRVHHTPLLGSTLLGKRAGVRLHLKCESLQRTGSFKARGALNAMMQLSPEAKARGVVTVSAGNHAQALAWAASEVGVECIACMPQGSSPTKIKATEGYGGRVEVVPGERKAAFDRAEAIAAEGRTLVHPFNNPHVAAGQGTTALEILEDAPDIDAIVVPIGGGGLISGIAVAAKGIKPDIRIFGVEPVGAATMRRSLDAGMPQPVTPNTVADGLAAPMVGDLTFDAVRRYVDDVVLVTDEDITAAMRDIMSYARLVVEPAGAAALAAVLTSKVPLARGANVVAIASGGNMDLDRLKTLL
jgi:threonine dehydratase